MTYFANGKHLAAGRHFAGLSQRALAERAGTHINSVKYHERRTNPATGHAPERFATVLAELGVVADVVDGRAILRA